LIRALVEEFPTEGNRQQAARQTESPIKRQRLEATARKIASIVTSIAEGDYRKNLTERLDKLEGGKARLEAELEIAEPPVLRLHPKLADIYAEKAAKLEAALNAPSIKTETSENLRRLIDKVELAPRPEGNGLDAHLYGDLAQILMFRDAGEHKRKLPRKPAPGSQLLPLAGTRNQRCRTVLWWPLGRVIFAPVYLQQAIPRRPSGKVLEPASKTAPNVEDHWRTQRPTHSCSCTGTRRHTLS